MSNRTLNLDERLYAYLLQHSLRETDTMQRLREVTAQQEWSQMQIAPEQGQFMALLVELLGAKRIIEVGTYTGYSALCMAQALPEDGQLICCDVSEEWTSIGQDFWQQAGVAERIQLHIAPALDTLQQLLEQGEAGQFDMAFIDADKTNYPQYYEQCLQLLRPGGLLLLDNMLWDGAVANPENQEESTQVLRALNTQLQQDERVSVSVVPIGDGVSLVRKR